MLYLRMLLSMFVGLYTSRVVLQTLGVDDYGIYGVVGGVVAMLGFLNGAMAGATGRYITFDLGRGDLVRLNQTFSTAVIVHFIIAGIIILVSETLGLWFLCNKLVIPADRMYAAHWVFQLSLISASINILQTPFSACIMSHEKMDVYAYIEVLNSFLKLLIVYLLVISSWDKLIVYAFLVLAVSITIQTIYFSYCLRHYPESHFHWIWNKPLLKSMLTFSGWDMFGSMSFTLAQQGRNFIVNIFFGVALNAACGLATTVQGIILGFSNNILSAFRPQIIKLYAANEVGKMQSLMLLGYKSSFLLLMLITIPLCLEMDYILQLWLGIVPNHAADFCRILLLQNAFVVLGNYFTTGIHATGDVHRFYLISIVNLLPLPLMYVIFRFWSLDPNWTYYLAFGAGMMNVAILGAILKKQVADFKMLRCIVLWLRSSLITLLCIVPIYFVQRNLPTGFIRVVIVSMLYALITLFVSYWTILSDTERSYLKQSVLNYLRRH